VPPLRIIERDLIGTIRRPIATQLSFIEPSLTGVTRQERRDSTRRHLRRPFPTGRRHEVLWSQQMPPSSTGWHPFPLQPLRDVSIPDRRPLTRAATLVDNGIAAYVGRAFHVPIESVRYPARLPTGWDPIMSLPPSYCWARTPNGLRECPRKFVIF
jgi:hypothetical protein